MTDEKLKMEEVALMEKSEFSDEEYAYLELEVLDLYNSVFLRDSERRGCFHQRFTTSDKERLETLIKGVPDYRNQFSKDVTSLSKKRINNCIVGEKKPCISSLNFSDGSVLESVNTSDGIIETVLSEGNIRIDKNAYDSEAALRSKLEKAGFNLDHLNFKKISDLDYEPKGGNGIKDFSGYKELKRKGVISVALYDDDKRFKGATNEIAVYENSNNLYLLELENDGTIKRKILQEETHLDKDMKRAIRKNLRIENFPFKRKLIFNNVKNAAKEYLERDERMLDTSVINHMLSKGGIKTNCSYLECKLEAYGGIYGCIPINGLVEIKTPKGEDLFLRSPPESAIGLGFLNDSKMKIRQERSKIAYIS